MTSTPPTPPAIFDDLLAANRTFAATLHEPNFTGKAEAGVLVVTCMDSRIEPLRMIGLDLGDAKILRNPGGRVTDPVLVGIVLGVDLLNVNRVMVVEHTRCAMGSSTEAQMRESLTKSTGQDSTWMTLGMIDDQRAALAEDIRRVKSHPLIPDTVAVGGFIYDVDTGLLESVC
jgi:carbonic anhydrase